MTSIAQAIGDIAPPRFGGPPRRRLVVATATAKQSRFAVCLSGGSTPRRLYQELAAPPYRDAFPWDRVHWFWGDERFVPHGDPQSNYRMVDEAMLARVPVPPEQIHPIPTEGLGADAAAEAYERELQAFYGAEHLDPARPLFDVVLLGVGGDGHTASLFPGASALAERSRWVVAVARTDGNAGVTLTYPALESCAHLALIVTGADKRAILGRVRQGDSALPSARLAPQGDLWLFADVAAVEIPAAPRV